MVWLIEILNRWLISRLILNWGIPGYSWWIARVQLGFSLTRWVTRPLRIQLLGRGAYGEVTLVQDALDVLRGCWKWFVTGLQRGGWGLYPSNCFNAWLLNLHHQILRQTPPPSPKFPVPEVALHLTVGHKAALEGGNSVTLALQSSSYRWEQWPPF